MSKTNLFALLTIFLLLNNKSTVFAQFQTNENEATALYSDTLAAIHYDIHLTNINQTNKTLEGYTCITLVSKKGPLNRLKLELESLKVDSVFLEGIRTEAFVQERSRLVVSLQKALQNADTTRLTVFYHGHPFVDPSGWGGFHFSGDYALNLGVGFDVIPHNLGKAWYPCIDDFRNRALYDIYLTTTSNQKAISGGLLKEVVIHANNTSTWHWKTAFTLPAYLASATIGKYELVADTFYGQKAKVPVTLYCRPADTAKTAGTFIHLKQILGFFESCFGPYPFERVGYTASPRGLGAMEHASNITYPYTGWTGNTNQEWWYAHELSHMWFGDEVTCASAGDMWLNEGWAVWCESLYREGIYSKNAYQSNIRTKLQEVLQTTHLVDGGYFALYNIPQTLTYGSTVYQKGGQVVHTLRGYMGDSLFFKGIRAYLKHYAYHDATTADLCNFLSASSGINLQPFFKAWVREPGFPHFSIDSVITSGNHKGYDATVYVRQRLLGRTQYADMNHLEITFMDAKWNTITDTLVFSGPVGHKTFHLPFCPATAMADLNEKISDATTDEAKTITKAGEYDYAQSFCKLKVEKISDPAFVRVTNNWLCPDTSGLLPSGIHISHQQYWTVEGLFPRGFRPEGLFAYNNARGGYPTLATGKTDKPLMLYRPGAGHPWKEIDVRIEQHFNAGTLTVENLRPGEYALGYAY